MSDTLQTCRDRSHAIFRPTEVNLLLGDYSKAKSELGWEPKTSCKELAEIMIDHDLDLAQQEASLKSFA